MKLSMGTSWVGLLILSLGILLTLLWWNLDAGESSSSERAGSVGSGPESGTLGSTIAPGPRDSPRDHASGHGQPGALPYSSGEAPPPGATAAGPTAPASGKNPAAMTPLELFDLLMASPGADKSTALLPVAMDGAMDLLLLTGQAQEVVDLQVAHRSTPPGKLRLFRQVDGKTLMADASPEQFPWLFELARWQPGSGRDLGAIAAELRLALEGLAALESSVPQPMLIPVQSASDG